jgi:hypothetical protein
LIDQGDLIVAQKYEDANRQLMVIQTERNRVNSQSTRRAELEIFLDRVREKLNEQREKMKAELEAHDARTEESVRAQENESQEECRVFDEETEGELPPLHKKFSQGLLNMREQERFLLRTRRFEDAGYTRMEADEREKAELAELREIWRATRETQKAKLLEAHRRKIVCLKENAERTRRKIEATHQAEIERMEQSIANLEKRIGNFEKGIREGVSGAPSPPPERAPSRGPPRVPAFVTQPPTPASTPGTVPRSHAPAKVVYRPFMSKWRIKYPQSMVTGPKV